MTMPRGSWILLVVWLLHLVCAAKTFTLFYRAIDSNVETSWGELVCEGEEVAFDITRPVESDSDQSYCIGTHSLPHHECFGVVKDLNNLQITIIYGEETQDTRISVSPGHDGIQATSKQVAEAPVPAMRANRKIKVAAGKTTSEIQDSVPDDEEAGSFDPGEINKTSWVKRNWMYLVPPLIILFIMLPDGVEEGEEPT